LKNVQLNDLKASSIHVGDTATISGLMINNSLNLEDASFLNLKLLEKIVLPIDPSLITIDGMEYRKINTKTTKPTMKKYATLPEPRQPICVQRSGIREIRTVLCRSGLIGFADQVYFNQRYRLSRESNSPIMQLRDLFCKSLLAMASPRVRAHLERCLRDDWIFCFSPSERHDSGQG
jgi:hypothetical protein